MYSASAQLDDRAAGLAVGVADRLDHLRVREVVGAQARGVEHDLVLLHHAADGRDLGHVRDRLQLELQEPVLQRAQLREIVPAAAVDQRVLVNPAHARRIGPSEAFAASGSRDCTWFRYSSTRERAQ